MKSKKLLTFVLVGAMVISVSLVGEGIGSGDSVMVAHAAENTISGNSIDPTPAKSEAEIGVERVAAQAAAEAAREAEAFVQAAVEAGASMEVYVQSLAENKSVGEYMNNAVTQTPGLETVTPVGQGGSVIINGVPTNNTFSIQKPLLAHVQSAQAQAAGLGGNVMNVVDVKGSASFETATVNFYMPGVTAGQNIQVYQYADGVWNSVAVSEIREDHVVVDMTSYGVLAFVEVPVQ